MDDDHNAMAELERLDRFLGGEEDGHRPIDVLRRNGISIPDERELDDAALHAKLWEILHGMAAIAMVVESTDHLSDRELYRWLVTDGLCEETFLPLPGTGGTCHTSPIGGCSEEDNEIYLRYYADDEERERWQNDFGEALPPKEKAPYDRDRLLPGQEVGLGEGEVQ